MLRYDSWPEYNTRLLKGSHGYYFLEINDNKEGLKIGNQIIIYLSGRLYPTKLSIQNYKKGAYILLSKDLLRNFDVGKYFKVKINYLDDKFHAKVSQHNLVIPKRIAFKDCLKKDDTVYLSAYDIINNKIYFKNLISSDGNLTAEGKRLRKTLLELIEENDKYKSLYP